MAEVSGTSVAGCRAVVIMQYAGPLVTKQFPGPFKATPRPRRAPERRLPRVACA